ncbi:hypothetical protein R1sor_005003 [Riccia sorocarpa]|uniref:Ubiquitin-like protease family profile domain-containing protein n=1 Tax=Riccia sorocarpa TaxID=122646 RepID=A0ABD3HIK3_9MARC
MFRGRLVRGENAAGDVLTFGKRRRRRFPTNRKIRSGTPSRRRWAFQRPSLPDLRRGVTGTDRERTGPVDDIMDSGMQTSPLQLQTSVRPCPLPTWLAVDDIMDFGMQTSPMPPVRNTEPASGSQPAPPMRGSKKKKKEVSNPKRKKVIPEVQAPSRADQYKEPTIGNPTGQTSGRGSNQPMTSKIPVDDRICSIGVLEESASNLATHTMSHISLVLEEHKCLRRLQAELEERLAALAEIEKENLALSNKVHTLEAEKQCMSDRVTLMSRLDLYELLEAKLDGFQLANHAGVVGNFENLTLTTTRKWTEIPGLNLDRFQQCPDEFPSWKKHCSLCTSSLGFLPSINTGVCQHNFHFTCFWKYASTKRLCPICRTALPDATYEFFCTIFVPQGNKSINPNTRETVTMEEDVEREELVGGRGRHVTRNEVDVVSTCEHKRFTFIEMNRALKMWVAENALRDISFVKGHRTLKYQIDRNGIEQAYSNICESLKIAAQNHPDPIQYYEHMLGIFDSYVNPDGDPDVHHVVMGLDADDFSVDKLLGPQELQAPPARRDIDGADFEDDLSKRERIRLQSDIIAMRDVLPPVTRSARTRLDYDALVGPSYVPPPADVEEVISVGEDISAGAPAEKEAIMDLVLHTGDTPTNAPTGCIADVVNLEEDEGIKSPPPSQMIPVRDTVVHAGDVINCYINERFLGKPRDELHNMFYVNTFWFTLASNLVHKYEKSKFSLEKLKPITRLRNSICPDLRDGDLLIGMPAWIFIPVHGKQHWSLAIIRLIGNQCRLCHLDSHTGIHETSKIFHVLKTFVAHTLPIDTNQIVEDIFEIDEQRNEYTCGFHVLQMLAGASKKELALDRCYMVERLQSIAKLDQVTSFEIMMSSYLEGKLKIAPY